MILNGGSVNPTALIVPDLYVQIIPPQVALLNGVPTNKIGIIGTATWGPTNAPTPISNMIQYSLNFGAIQARKFDLGTAVAAAVMQGANNIACVRVTDGTDVAATIAVKDGAAVTGLTATAKYTGSLGNSVVITVANGSKASTYKFTVQLPNLQPEIFDNIGGSGAALWANAVSAINNGNTPLRGPSNLITATVGTSTAVPALATYTLASGTDGATTITSSVLVGQDTLPRKGQYCLRGTGCSIGVLADADDSTQWGAQDAFGASEGLYMILTAPAGQTVTTAQTAKSTAALDSPNSKLMMGDWVYFNDTVNNQIRLISPTGFVGGRLANLSPEQSSLNKQIFGVVGTQTTYANLTYGEADLAILVQAGIDVVYAPSPGGNYFACRIGHNASSNPIQNGDNYTRMTNYIAATLNAGMGVYVGQLQTAQERQNAKGTIQSFLSNLQDKNMIGDPNGGPAYSVILDATNNPSSSVALGYQFAAVNVKYLAVVEKFLINLQGGTSVQIASPLNGVGQ